MILVSVNDAGIAGDLHSYDPVISDDGDVVAFTSVASTLVPGPATTASGIFVREIAAGRTTRITPPGPASPVSYTSPSMSGDGRRIVYHEVNVARPSIFGAVLYDRSTGVTRGLFPFLSTVQLLDATGQRVFLYDPFAQRFLRQAVDLGSSESFGLGTAPSGATGGPLVVSPSGRYAVGGSFQVFLDMDLQTETSGFHNFAAPMLAAAFDRQDRWLVFASQASTLLPGSADNNGVADIFVTPVAEMKDLADNDTDIFWISFYGTPQDGGDSDGDGVTNAAEYAAGTHPTASFRRFLAEGATGSFFTTSVALANPDPTNSASVLLTFAKGDGTQVRHSVSVPPLREQVVAVGGIPGLEAADFATTIESNLPVAVSRTMAWDTLPLLDRTRGYGMHAEGAVAAPAAAWFLAEGSTVLDFDLFYLLYNPQATTTHATVRFLRPGGAVTTRTYDLPARSRTTIYVNTIAGLEETDVSGDIAADAPIIVERAMYRSRAGQPFELGHASVGVTALATQWFLAEGATGPFFDLYVLIANPSNTAASIDAHYAKPDGSVVTRQYTVPANGRFSVFVDAIAGLENTPVATTITSTNSVPVVVERAMYWPGGFFDYYEGHSSAGSTVTARRWLVASAENDGTQGGQTFVLIANTSSVAGTATIRVLPTPHVAQAKPLDPVTVALPPNSRTTVPIAGFFGSFGVLVESAGTTPVDLVVESAVYRDAGGITWSAGANALATPLP